MDQELATVVHWLGAYRKLNDTVSFQPVPPPAEVQSKVPAGRAALGVKEYKLPTPSYGPGSAGYAGRGDGGVALALDQLHLLGEQHPARQNLVALQGGGGGVDGEHASGGGAGGYAGQGAYY